MHQEENKLIALRRSKIAADKAAGKAYPNDFLREAHIGELQSRHSKDSKEKLQKLSLNLGVAGRIMRMRGPFMVIQEGDAQLQLYAKEKDLPRLMLSEFFADASSDGNGKSGAKSDDPQSKSPLDIGDIVGAKGELFKTGTGELALRVESLRILAKALRPLPDKHKGLQDTELRYRQRYVDLIVNDDSRRIFKLRTNLIRHIRRYFEETGFMEVETPVLQTIASGAVARPFKTHHKALDQTMYLRIALELFLKRLIVGGFEKVFELNRCFRNEGLSTRHNPEFTMLEFYAAYADYQQLMDFTEDLLRYLAQEVLGDTGFESQGVKYDFAKPFARMTLEEAIIKHCKLPKDALGAQLNKQSGKQSSKQPGKQPDRQARDEKILAVAESLGVAFDPAWPAGKVLLEIYEQKVEPQLQQPTFITQYPTAVSPLSRQNDSNPEVVDRFELIIGGRELANGFSELNDPEEQAARFRQQAAAREAGDEEAMAYDADFITALEYGMPPTAGEGIGIDRLVMLFADVPSIKDVLLFPHNRPLDNSHNRPRTE